MKANTARQFRSILQSMATAKFPQLFTAAGYSHFTLTPAETGTVLTLYRPFVFDVNDYDRAYARRELLNFLPLADWTRSEFQNDPDGHWDRLTFPPTV